MYAGVLSVWMAIPHVCLVSLEAKEDVRSPGTRVTDDGELSCGCRELSLVSLVEQLVLLNTELSLLPHKLF